MERLKILLNEVKEEIGLKDSVKLKIVPMKQKIASLSLKTKILRLNRDVVGKLSDEELRYIILHELIHLKVGDVNHGSLFLDELKRTYGISEATNLEIRIIERLISEKLLDIRKIEISGESR